jgi:hypothetical protein
MLMISGKLPAKFSFCILFSCKVNGDTVKARLRPFISLSLPLSVCLFAQLLWEEVDFASNNLQDAVFSRCVARCECGGCGGHGQ